MSYKMIRFDIHELAANEKISLSVWPLEFPAVQPIADVVCEAASAMRKHSPMNSAHEAYSVIVEELDEFWDEVKKKRRDRDPARLKDELVQIGAMALRALVDLQLTPGPGTPKPFTDPAGGEPLPQQTYSEPVLRACPFCGGSPVVVTESGAYLIQCGEEACDAYCVVGPYPTHEEAGAAWNHRA